VQVDHLGCDIVSSTYLFAHNFSFGVFTVLENVSCTEVDDLDGSTRLFANIQQNIFRLEITMDDTLSMAVGDGLNNLFSH
jgi:hypothetical protein